LISSGTLRSINNV